MPEAAICGTVRAGVGFRAGAGYCRWHLVFGPSWALRCGDAMGHSHTAEADAIDGHLDFSQPIDAVLQSRSLCGWPQLLLSVWQVDSHGRHDIAGYGIARVPAATGHHALEVACWRPEGSLLQELSAFFLGALPQLTDTSVLIDSSRRQQLSTVTTGSVMVELQVLLSGFELEGVELPAVGCPAAMVSPL